MRCLIGQMLLAIASPAAAAQQIVVTAPALPAGIAPGDVPAASTSLDADALREGGTTNLLRTIGTDLPGVALDEGQGNPYQPSLLYRGYEASPLGGDAQGLAVYVDGARFNQPFGDTSNWDLLPDIAIRRVTLEGSNPVFGLNALGGALAIDLKTGRDAQGIGGEAAIGRFGKRQIAGEAGFDDGPFSGYLAGSVQHDDGWRDFSPSTVHQIYGQIGVAGDWGHLDLRLLGADTHLTGNGTAPVELLAVRRKSVFTWPDSTANRYGRALLSGEVRLGGSLHLRPSAYVERFHQRTANGDLSDAEPCDGNDSLLCLEGEDDAPITSSSDQAFPAFAGDEDYAQLNQTRTRTTGYGAAIELIDEGAIGAMSNRLAAGIAYDGARSRFDAQSLLGLLTDNRGFGESQGVIDMADGPIRPVDVIADRGDVGLYAADVLTVLPTLDLTIAGRFNHDHVRLDDRLGTSLSGRHSYQRFNPSAGLVWRLAPDVSVYGGYAEANRAPTPAELSCADPAAPCSLSAFFLSDPDLHQVVSRTFEGGVRGSRRLGGLSLGWHVGGWRATNSHDIVFTASDARGRAFFRNVGTTRRQGIEAELTASNQLWNARLSYVLTDATYRTGFLLDSPDNPAAADGVIAVRRGNRIPGVPRHQLKASIIRHFGDRAWLSASASYSSGRWLQGDDANLTRPTRGYALANLAGGLRVHGRVELFAEIDNLFDRHYATFGGFSETDEVNFAEVPGIANPRSLSPGAPRTWLTGLRLPIGRI